MWVFLWVNIWVRTHVSSLCLDNDNKVYLQGKRENAVSVMMKRFLSLSTFLIRKIIFLCSDMMYVFDVFIYKRCFLGYKYFFWISFYWHKIFIKSKVGFRDFLLWLRLFFLNLGSIKVFSDINQCLPWNLEWIEIFSHISYQNIWKMHYFGQIYVWDVFWRPIR